MSRKKIILVGAGGHAKSCIDVIEKHGEYEIAGLVGLPEQINAEHSGYKVIGSDKDLGQLYKDFPYAIITVGQIKTANIRKDLYEKLKNFGFNIPSIISKSAQVSSRVIIEEGSIVMQDVIINSGVSVGKNCIINTRALIEHDVKVGDHTHISTGVIVNGGAIIGHRTFIGSGSIIRDGIKVGDDCLVGMGMTVLANLENEKKLAGD